MRTLLNMIQIQRKQCRTLLHCWFRCNDTMYRMVCKMFLIGGLTGSVQLSLISRPGLIPFYNTYTHSPTLSLIHTSHTYTPHTPPPTVFLARYILRSLYARLSFTISLPSFSPDFSHSSSLQPLGTLLHALNVCSGVTSSYICLNTCVQLITQAWIHAHKDDA